MSKTMLCLVGEQPVPNILPIRYCQPDAVALIHTHTTKRVSDNLAPLLKKDYRVIPFEITAYDILKARNGLEKLIAAQQWRADELIFNLTGGTKPMSWAAFQLAQELSAEIVYLQSEGGQSLLYFYRFADGELKLEKKEIAAAQLSIKDYLHAHGLTTYHLNKRKQWFEELIRQALEPPVVSEIISNVKLWTLELDHVVRCETQFGIIEAKSGEGDKKKVGIDQLSTASQREFLGTFVKRFLVLKSPLGVDNKRLADAHGIIEIVLPSADENEGLSEEDKHLLIEIVTKNLGAKR